MDLSEALGAGGGISVESLVLYIPDRDKDGNEIGNQRWWVLEAATLLAPVGGGVTIMPPVEGGWLNSEGTIIWEKPILIYTYIDPDKFVAALPELRRFLHALGTETRQGEVAFEIGGSFYRITTFDPSSTWEENHG